ncbi:hypothetical protein [Hymenobacter chitinivorans]|uniref:Uncharacterized protein n=1 Tax=Hymenobacter chitinivorans DSM 11115 TaxID=1121954 RepID=A0A2M9B5M6_9BACT|nr:hypothetical protein [Hymenobacter chitinivorans]PJJ53251.1 hypothetical protein CLV45_3911 [Hymenobacter chitinivorans DSM 11115]
METLLHLIFTFCKIAIQASVVATLLLKLVRWYAPRDPAHPLVRASRHGKRFWWASGFLVSLALFGFSLTYWGNHGLGDYARIPLGHGEAMEELNGVQAYFEPLAHLTDNADNPEVLAYQVHDGVLCVALGPDSTFVVYYLASKHHQLFADRAAYAAHARSHHLPRPAEFERFKQHYSRYWNGWRFWLLA